LWFSDQAYHSMIHKLFYENQDWTIYVGSCHANLACVSCKQE
jgi:hypothetical protein